MADYEALARAVYEAFQNVTVNSHASINRDNNVIYPYLTYDIRTNPGESRNEEGLILDIQLFDNVTSYSRLYTLASSVSNGFKDLIVLKDNLHIRFDVRNGASNWVQVPTADPNIIRLEGTIQAKIDWRENR